MLPRTPPVTAAEVTETRVVEANNATARVETFMMMMMMMMIYPLVTHDPNMLKKKSRGNLVGKIKVSLPERKYQNFC